jgi:hypothetical protein
MRRAEVLRSIEIIVIQVPLLAPLDQLTAASTRHRTGGDERREPPATSNVTSAVTAGRFEMAGSVYSSGKLNRFGSILLELQNRGVFLTAGVI